MISRLIRSCRELLFRVGRVESITSSIIFSGEPIDEQHHHDAERIRMLRPSAALLALLAMTVPTKGLRSSVSMVARESVAVIGGGIAGLSFAHRLAASSKQFQVSVFDTGRLRPGGRCSSRFPGDASKENDHTSYQYLSQFVTDNAAQVLAVPETREFQAFAAQVSEWEKQGVVKRFAPETVCNIQSTKSKAGFSLKPLAPELAMYYGANGMGAIPQALVASATNNGLVDLHQDVWVSPSNGVTYKNGKWTVKASGRVLGQFDRLVIAHNGKCADRLMSKTPAKQVHNLLKTNFAPSVAASGGSRMTLNSIYSLTVAVNKKSSVLSKVLPDPFVCGFVQDNPIIRFISNQTRKYPSSSNEKNGGDLDHVEVWTILSSATFAKKFKGPQEALPEETVTEVSLRMMKALEELLNLPSESIPKAVLEQRLQLWGAALPINTWETSGDDKNGVGAGGYIYDADHAVGVCGDWLVQPSVAGAWTSGQQLADHFVASTDQNNAKSFGLEGSFVRSESASKTGIGAFPSAKKAIVI
jgi:predicted NAD/FAD-dependent oxidoreductase